VKQICKRVAEFIVKMLLHRFGLSIEVLFLFCLGVHAADIPSLVRKAKPAVVQVIASDANWAPVRTGTGFFISADGELLTNFHVVRGATHISARTDKGSIFVFERAIAESADSDVVAKSFPLHVIRESFFFAFEPFLRLPLDLPILRVDNRFCLRQCFAARSHQPANLKGTRLDCLLGSSGILKYITV
jgi:hypothetical protein